MKIYTEQEKDELRKQARRSLRISVAEIADNWYGLTLYVSKKGNHLLKCYEHQSLVFDTKTNEVYYGSNRLDSMTPYDFVADYEGISKLDARTKLDTYQKTREEMNVHKYIYDEKNDEVVSFYDVLLPERGQQEILRESLESLGIYTDVIDQLVRESLVYVDTDNNIVFIGYDKKNMVKYGIIQDMEYIKHQTICKGSSGNCCFKLVRDESQETVIVDTVLNALALYSMNKCNVLCIPEENVEEVIENLENEEWFKNQKIVKSIYGELEVGNRIISIFDTVEWFKEFAQDKGIEVSHEIQDLTLIEMINNQEKWFNEISEEKQEDQKEEYCI